MTWLPRPEEAVDATETLRMVVTDREVSIADVALVLGDELGRGGMGVVYRGEQSRLGRSVAVKMCRPDRASSETQLVREGRIAGRLEHPNIVPVHDLLMSPEGQPQLVLKCIDGVGWDKLIEDETRLPKSAQGDVLGWHLNVLLQVCNAVGFAHAQGVLHRDLKPANVMVGQFGEVCVVDWGVAVSLERDDADRLVEVIGQESVVGTLAYMPAEMLCTDATQVGTASDVFLLAGTLFHVLAGQAPRIYPSLAVYYRHCEDPPKIPSNWPAPLRRLLQRGLALRPEQRPTVDAFRSAIEAFLAQRDAEALLERTLIHVGTLKELLSLERHDSDEHQQIYNVYGACQFGLQEVVRRQPEHKGARSAWSSVIEVMVHYELGRGGASSARLLLSQWAEPPMELIERLQAAESEAERARASDVRVLKDADTSRGRAQRLGVFAVVGAVWVGLPLVLVLLGVERGYPRMILRNVVVLTTLSVGLAVVYQPWMNTRMNRNVAAMVALSPILGLVSTAVLWGQDVPVPTATVMRALVDGFLIIVAAAIVDHRIWPAAATFLGATLLAAWLPVWTTPLLVAGSVVFVANAIYLWRRPIQASEASEGLIDRR